jgi:hypothetical protein
MTTDSPLAVAGIIIAMLAGATVGIGVLAALASEAMRRFFDTYGDRDAELMATGEEQA